ncbi:MAG: transcription antitermination factor NusB [Christensenellales bacterium]|jgi:N utilization substance protein B
MARRVARDAAMKLAFEWWMGGSGEETLDELGDEICSVELDNVDRDYIHAVVDGIKDKQPELDDMIRSYAVDWKTERMSRVDLTILRLSVYEMLYCKEIPRKVSVSEAVDLASIYSGEKSAAFINGLLGSVLRALETEQ